MIRSDLLWPPGRPDEGERFDETYIGDGVYACHDGYQVWITTGDGSSIALEPSVLDSLIAYVAQRRKGAAA